MTHGQQRGTSPRIPACATTPRLAQVCSAEQQQPPAPHDASAPQPARPPMTHAIRPAHAQRPMSSILWCERKRVGNANRSLLQYPRTVYRLYLRNALKKRAKEGARGRWPRGPVARRACTRRSRPPTTREPGRPSEPARAPRGTQACDPCDRCACVPRATACTRVLILFPERPVRQPEGAISGATSSPTPR